MEVQPGFTFSCSASQFASGLTNTIGVQIRSKAIAGATVARRTTGITEDPTGSGRYITTLVAPYTAGPYEILWDNGALTPGNYAIEDLDVSPTARTDF